MPEQRPGRPRGPLSADLSPRRQNFLKELRLAIARTGTTQADLAMHLGMSVSSLSRILSGHRPINDALLAHVLARLTLSDGERQQLFALAEAANEEQVLEPVPADAGRLADQLSALRQKSGLSVRDIATRLAEQGVPVGKSTVERTLGSPDRSPLLALRLANVLLDALPEHLRGPASEPVLRTLLAASPVLRTTPIDGCNPYDLEVHPSGPGNPSDTHRRDLSQYIIRDHDRELTRVVQQAAAGHSRMAVLVGGSGTGKTRALWEAIQELPQDWRLWHPFDPSRPEEALSGIARVQPHTVVWLNESQFYLGGELGEPIAAALRSLLSRPERAPVLVLGTLWPEYLDQMTHVPAVGNADAFAQARQLLACRIIHVPDTFAPGELKAAQLTAEGTDGALREAVVHGGSHVTQYLASAPALLQRYVTASPASHAVLTAAMDALRLGAGPHLPGTFLAEAASDYLTDPDFDQLSDDWMESVVAHLTKNVPGRVAPLARVRPRRRLPEERSGDSSIASGTGPSYRLAEYLYVHGSRARGFHIPPVSFWQAADVHLSTGDLTKLAESAEARHRLYWAYRLRVHAADAGNTDALVALARQCARMGETRIAERLAVTAAGTGNTEALLFLAQHSLSANKYAEAESLFLKAMEAGNAEALLALGDLREKSHSYESAEAFYERAAHAGQVDALLRLATLHEKRGDPEAAESLARTAADRGSAKALTMLMFMSYAAGDRHTAEQLCLEATRAGDSEAFSRLLNAYDEDYSFNAAEALAEREADAGNTEALIGRAADSKKIGDFARAEADYRQAAAGGNARALGLLAEMKEETGDPSTADHLIMQALEAGDTIGLLRLADRRLKSEGPASAEVLYRMAADAGLASGARLARFWKYGLEPDGTPSAPWQPA